MSKAEHLPSPLSKSSAPLSPSSRQMAPPGTCLLSSRWKASLAPPPTSPASNSPESPVGSTSKLATSSPQPPRLGPLLPSDCAFPDRDLCVPLTSSSGCLQCGQAHLLKSIPCSAPAHTSYCTGGCRSRSGAARALWPTPMALSSRPSATWLFWGLVPLTC